MVATVGPAPPSAVNIRRLGKSDSQLWPEDVLRSEPRPARQSQPSEEEAQHSQPQLAVEAIPVDDLTTFMVVLYYVHHSYYYAGTTSRADDLARVATAVGWVLLGVAVATAELACLLSLGVANWPRCVALGDCALGMECVMLKGLSQWQRPSC